MRITLQHAHRGIRSEKGPAHKLDADTEVVGFYFEIQADGNHETLATSEVYVEKRDAQRAIDLICEDAANGEYEFVDKTVAV